MTVTTKKNEWDKANMRTVSCRLRKEEAEMFRAYAEHMGTTPHTLLAEYVHKCIEAHKNIPPEERANVAALRNELASMRDTTRVKLEVMEAQLRNANIRAANAEALVNKWLRSADEK